MIDFEGRLCEMGGGPTYLIRGRYEWIDQLTPEPRIRGEILTKLRYRDRQDGIPADRYDPRVKCPYEVFGQRQFVGRAVRLTVPDVGLCPVRLRSPGIWQDVAFEAWAPPVPNLAPHEIARALWTPIADALAEAGLDDLAGIARAASVLIEGFRPDPRRERKEGD